MTQLVIRDLQATANKQPILNGVHLTVKPGEIHAIMGPNGSGKSTLAHILAGKPGYEVSGGSVEFAGESWLPLVPEQRAARGFFLAFQNPVEIPGVNNMYFIRSALNCLRKQRNEAELDAVDFLQWVRSQLKLVGLDESFLHRALNEKFSGGEKKRNEMLQMLLLQPQLAVLDEIDSGLDIDGLQMVMRVIQHLHDGSRSFVVITHHPHWLQTLKPDVVHVMMNGRLVYSGDSSVVAKIEKQGYGWLGLPKEQKISETV